MDGRVGMLVDTHQKVVEGTGEHHHLKQGGHKEVRSAGDFVCRIIKGFRLERTIKITSFQPPCHQGSP